MDGISMGFLEVWMGQMSDEPREGAKQSTTPKK